jgi:hypothetical protein
MSLSNYTEKELTDEIERRSKMGLRLSDLSVLAYANNFSLWHYKTPDQAVEGNGYFNAGTDMMRVNDLIIANVDTARPSQFTRLYIVTGNTKGVVTVSKLV